MRGNAIPQPVLVTVDPVNACDLNCMWCNSAHVLGARSGTMSKQLLINIARFLAQWKTSPNWPEGVESVCIAGGGEPLLNQSIGDFINHLVEHGIEVGIVTNGTKIDKFIEPLSRCTWVGVSIDAGSPKTFKKLKGKDKFQRIIDNIRKLIDYSNSNHTRLGTDLQGYGVSYKYLLHPDNVHEVEQAVRIAKDIGCKNFHLRPMGVPWDRLDAGDSIIFSQEVVDEFNAQIERARKYESLKFGVFAITHKFDSELNIANYFERCYAIFMTAVFMPSTDGDDDHFIFGLCCDRRGDERLEIGRDLDDVRKVESLWGSEKHWSIFDSINVRKCPRCTYQPHNQVFENVISKDNMTYRFI